MSVPASGSDRWWPRGQTETVENLASDGRILNSGQNTYPAAAAWTFQHNSSTAKILAISWDQQ